MISNLFYGVVFLVPIRILPQIPVSISYVYCVILQTPGFTHSVPLVNHFPRSWKTPALRTQGTFQLIPIEEAELYAFFGICFFCVFVCFLFFTLFCIVFINSGKKHKIFSKITWKLPALLSHFLLPFPSHPP